MANTDLRDEWQAAQSRLKVVVADAGLEGALKTAAKDRDDIAAQRSLVFGLAHEAQRKRIIYWSRECDRLCRATARQEHEDAEREVRLGAARIRRNTLWGVVIFAIVIVSGAGYLVGVVAALIAAALCLLAGFDQIRRADRRAVLSTEDAKRRLQEQEAVLAELGTDDGGIYTANEADTGFADAPT
jgi:hypothetical protein